MKTLSKTPPVCTVMERGVGSCFSESEAYSEISQYLPNNVDDDTAENWMREEMEYHAGHVHIIELEEFFERYMW
jgi:hypothetical protein